MEVLTAYVREKAPWLPKGAQPSKGDESPQEQLPAPQQQPPPKLAADIQAILTVLGRRTRTTGKGIAQQPRKGEERRLNLAKTDLRGADLVYAYLEGAFLQGAHLEGADLNDTYLEGAFLRDAHLEGANLHDAYLEGAVLSSAYLSETINLTREQLCTVKTLVHASLDLSLLAQIQKHCPQLLEKLSE
jgi:hypothetical protein